MGNSMIGLIHRPERHKEWKSIFINQRSCVLTVEESGSMPLYAPFAFYWPCTVNYCTCVSLIDTDVGFARWDKASSFLWNLKRVCVLCITNRCSFRLMRPTPSTCSVRMDLFEWSTISKVKHHWSCHWERSAVDLIVVLRSKQQFHTN